MSSFQLEGKQMTARLLAREKSIPGGCKQSDRLTFAFLSEYFFYAFKHIFSNISLLDLRIDK